MKEIKKVGFEKRITALLLLVILIVLSSTFLVYRNLDSIVSEISAEARPDETLVVIKGVLNDITVAENKAKTYSLNPESEYLEEFNLRTENVQIKIDLLKKFTGNNEKRLAQVVQLDSLINEKILVLEEFLIFQDRYRTSQVLEEVIYKVEHVGLDENPSNSVDSSQDEENKSFFNKLFNKRKDRKNKEKDSGEASSKNQIETNLDLEKLDKELIKLKSKENELSQQLKEHELALIEKDQIIMLEIYDVVSTIEEEESLNLSLQLNEAELKSGRTNFWIIIYSILTCVFLIFAGWAVYIYVRKNELYKKALKKAKIETDIKNQEITSSINYAKRIQGAILPELSSYNKDLPDSFILYEPKDIVAGDFYWIIKDEDVIYIAVADCTGHGVPGALVSVVCHNALNRSVREFNLTSPAEILECARRLIIETFEERDDVVYDGMDIALCRIDTKTKQIDYSGANNSLYLIPNISTADFTSKNAKLKESKYTIHDGNGESKLIEIKPDKQPVARYFRPKPFTNHTINLAKGDAIYMFTDGFADQFGGPKSKKFTYKKFRENLLANHELKMDLQKHELEKSLQQWMQDLEQIDDVCVVGIRL